jgi:hypothetical protein
MAIITSAGAIPTPPADLLNAEIAAATALSPGLTTNLPGSLIEDLASTAAGALVVQDQAYVDLVNSVSPVTANPSILYQLGQVYGVQQGLGANTSVYVTFTGLAGFVIPVGFTVSDGTYQYTVQDGGIIETGGQSAALYCLATTAGSWAVPVNTVTQIITSVPAGYTLTCTNLTAGVPGSATQSLQSYQAQVIQAGNATAQGMPTFLKTQLQRVSGVQGHLIAVRNVGANQWQVICGGGDPYAVGNAIFTGLFDIANLIGSTLRVLNITNGYPAVVSTNLNHGYTTGQIMQVNGVVGMTGINGVNYVAVVIDEKNFSLAVQISTIVWSSSTVTVTTVELHGIPTSTTVTGTIYGCTPTGYNGTYAFTSTGTNTFTYPLTTNPGTSTAVGYTDYDSTYDGGYINGGVVTPNLRNITVSINDYPDSYNITFVNPPEQTVLINLIWNTISPNYVAPAAIAALGAPAIVDYINNIYVGQPINLFELQNVFEASISSIISPALISKMIFTIEINGIETFPLNSTGLIYGDPESYFYTTTSAVTIVQG